MAARAPFPLPDASSAHPVIPEGAESTRDRLVAAAAGLIAGGGIAAASARAIAAHAGTAASAINYNLGGIERLLLSVFEQGVEDTRAWLQGRTREVAALPRTADGAAWALTHVTAAWVSDGRRLALLYQEALAAGAGGGPAAAWTRLWRDFWLEAAALLGLDPIQGRLLHVFFESEALYHLSAWSPALEAGALNEMSEHFAAVWLHAAERAPRGMVALATEAAGARPHGSVPPAAMRIAKAAAEVVEDRGLAGLTHRAVASRAGTTTGSVTHHFRSIEDLVAGAIRGQVQAMADEASAEGDAPPFIDEIASADRLFETFSFHAVAERPSSPVLRRRRLFLAAVRRTDLAAAGAVIRYSHGGTTRDALARLFVVADEMLPLHASVLSRLLSAIWFACAADDQPRASRAQLMAEIEAGFRRAARAR